MAGHHPRRRFGLTMRPLPFVLFARLRQRIATAVTNAAYRVARNIEGRDLPDDVLELGPDGIPRALSLMPRFKGYRRDAVEHGHNLVIRLDGVEQHYVVAYDIDARRVSAYDRDVDGNLKLTHVGWRGDVDTVIVHRKGAVTVERLPG